MKDSPFFDKLIVKSDSELENMLQNEKDFDANAIKVAKYIQEERENCVYYSTYIFSDLLDVKNHIDEEKYPVRAALLNNEISKRKSSEEYFNAKETQELILEKKSIQINPRLRISLEKADTKGLRETIDLDQLKEYLIKPKYGEFIKVSDSTVDLFIIYEIDKNQHGFSFEYQDKNNDEYFKSTLHGLSKEFSISFAKNFIEKGKNDLETLNWRKIKKEGSKFSSIFTYVYSVLFIIIALSVQFEINPISDLITQHKDTLKKPFLYFLFLISVLNIYSTREQFLHLPKLSNKEKFDTFFSILFPIILAAIIYFELI